jgi:hypothetical protein
MKLDDNYDLWVAKDLEGGYSGLCLGICEENLKNTVRVPEGIVKAKWICPSTTP